MRIQSESWDGKSRIGEVGAKSFTVTAESEKEAMLVAVCLIAVIDGINYDGFGVTDGTLETTSGETVHVRA